MGVKGCSWGAIPSNKELVRFLQQVSDRQYGGRYLPSRTLFDALRPEGWRQGAAILLVHGLPQTAVGWRLLMARFGLTAPVARHGVAGEPLMRGQRKALQCAAPLAGMPSLAEAGALRFGDGLPVISRLRPVRVWCLRCHRYVTVGHRQVWEVR